VVSGSPWPAVPVHRPIAALPDEAFIERVADYTGYRHVALNNPEMRDLILPALRADVEMHETYVPSAGDPLPVPITALRGADDTMVPAASAREWTHATSRGFEYLEFDGGHMYLADSAADVMRAIETRACGGQAPAGALKRNGDNRT
jgi:surfactin synthase thioesterase subunit